MKKPTENNRTIVTAEMIADVRALIVNNDTVTAFIGKISDKATRELHEVFVKNEKQDVKIADAFNKSNVAGQNLEGIVIARISYNIPYYGELTFTTPEYYREKAKLSLIKTIINALSTMGYIKKTSKLEREFVDGKPQYKTVVLIDFDGTETIKELTRGIYTEPGMLDGTTVHTKPGAKKLKLSSTQKTYLRNESSKAMSLVDVSADKLRAYYEQTEWYVNAVAKDIEDPILLSERVERYISVIGDLQNQERLYLTQWFDSRLRSYYTCSLLGINPHGDTFETSMWEFADAELISEAGYEELVWASVIIGIGRRNKEQALAYWDKHEDAVVAAMMDTDKNSFGEVFYNERMIQSIADYRNGVPSKFMLGIDYTTGGLQHFGTAFRSVKSMKASNIGGLKTVKDAHGIMGQAFGIEREAAKKINTPLLHGATYKSIAALITEATGVKHDAGQVQCYVGEAYGEEIHNIQTITDWGDMAYDTNNSTLMFTAPDGEKAQSTCYYKSVKMVVQGLEFEGKANYSSCTLHRDMPYILSAKGEQVHDEAKNRGFYANVTHAIDGAALRGIDASLRKHDKFYCRPGNMNTIREQGRSSALRNMRRNGYVSAIKEVAEHHKGHNKLPLPELVVGKGTESMVIESNNFIIA